MSLYLACEPYNDLCRVLQANGIDFERRPTFESAITTAGENTSVMLLAGGYPYTPSIIDPSLLATAQHKRLRLYIEFPSAVPGHKIVEPRPLQWERGVVTSHAFAPALERLRLLMIHGCVFVPLDLDIDSGNCHIAVAKVAGFDKAVYGLPPRVWPILYEQQEPRMLVSTTKLSQFVTARYAPAEAWRAVWVWVLGWLGVSTASIAWHRTVRPSYGKDDVLPPDAEYSSFGDGVGWFRRARLFVHPSWRGEAQRRLDMFPDGTGPGPLAEWPVGDGSCGMIEGARSTVNHDGTQYWSYQQRNDCMGEAAMAMALSAVIDKTPADAGVASNLMDYIYVHSVLAQGLRADPTSPSYGLVTWNITDSWVYYGDDNAPGFGTSHRSCRLGGMCPGLKTPS